MERFVRRGKDRNTRRGVPLRISFAVVSMVLTLTLGLVLSARIRASVARRGVEVATRTTRGAIALTIKTILSGNSYGRDGTPVSAQEQRAQADLISSLSRVLVANTDVVSVEAVLADGTVIGGANAPPVASKLGVEALVRWQHPERGLIPPTEFISVAEQTGMIRPLTWRVLRAALEQNRAWAEDGLGLRVSVNMSARSLLDQGFSGEVARLLIATGVPAERLELELTESSMMTDPDRLLAIMQDLRERGIGLSIDDFGTGYSSMTRLKNLPVNEIKIDQGFVRAMDIDPSAAAIVRSTLELARNLGVTVVAEGVETEAVRDELTELGCPAIQGYLLSKALPAAEFTSWLVEYRAARPDGPPNSKLLLSSRAR